MLDAIEEVHNRGFIHRDVKAVSEGVRLDGPLKYSRILHIILVQLCALEGQQTGVHCGFRPSQASPE
jgi:serine/threonine protein kinase